MGDLLSQTGWSTVDSEGRVPFVLARRPPGCASRGTDSPLIQRLLPVPTSPGARPPDPDHDWVYGFAPATVDRVSAIPTGRCHRGVTGIGVVPCYPISATDAGVQLTSGPGGYLCSPALVVIDSRKTCRSRVRLDSGHRGRRCAPSLRLAFRHHSIGFRRPQWLASHQGGRGSAADVTDVRQFRTPQGSIPGGVTEGSHHFRKGASRPPAGGRGIARADPVAARRGHRPSLQREDPVDPGGRPKRGW